MIELIHVLQVPYVTIKSEKEDKVGRGKKRAWCQKCYQLRDNTSFWAYLSSPHPSSNFAFYYEPHWSWCCEKCYRDKVEPTKMEREEYARLFKANCDQEFVVKDA